MILGQNFERLQSVHIVKLDKEILFVDVLEWNQSYSSSILNFFQKQLVYDFVWKFQISSKFVYSQLGPRNHVCWCFGVKLNWSWRHMKMSNLISRHLEFFPEGLAYDFGSKFQISLNFVYGQMWPENDVCWCFRVKSKLFWQKKTKISDVSSRHLEFFPKRLAYDFGSKFWTSSKCAYSQIGQRNIVCWCFRVKSKSFWQIMKRSSLRSRHLEFFPKGLTYDFGLTFQISSVCKWSDWPSKWCLVMF